MERGEHSAWPFVFMGAALVWLIFFFIYAGLFGALVSMVISSVDLGWLSSLLAAGASTFMLWFVYLDRWRVNEAYTSRLGFGPIQFAYVPIVSVGYALSRCVERLQTNFSSPAAPASEAPSPVDENDDRAERDPAAKP